ncbi:hypothetical protein PI125_g22002 [Phytophthora idaei]|nr:hypothetical protein PI125_g22002 [Phytophthora idaei]
MSGDSESVDDERDATSPTPPAEGTSESAYVQQVLRSFGSSFALAALEFLSEIAESSPEMTPEQLQALEQIVDRAMGEARERLCCSGNSNAKELHQERGGRLGDVLWLTCFGVLEWRKGSLGTNDCFGRSVCVIAGTRSLQVSHSSYCWSKLSSNAPSTESSDILRVIASTYTHLPVALKKFCLDQVATLVSTFVDEGPTIPFTAQMQLQLELLEHLATFHALDDSDDLDIMQWLCEYFPECFECCGVVIQLLSEQSDDEKAENDIGMIRLLDMCLLVIKAGLDYFETKRDDVCALLKILTSTITAALSHLASRYASVGAASEEISEARRRMSRFSQDFRETSCTNAPDLRSLQRR